MKISKLLSAALLSAVLASGAACAAERTALLPHDTGDSFPLVAALEERRTSYDFVDEDLTASELSTLLWATAGVNRDGGKRTYPTALDRRDMTLYVFTSEGAYRYIAERHELELVRAGDHRAATGTQPFVGTASLGLVYVQDTSKWTDMPADIVGSLGAYHSSSMAQNAYLYAASRGWACVARMSYDEHRIASLLGLDGASRVVFTQSVGRASGKEVAPRSHVLGGMTPETAQMYMAQTKRLLIVDVRPAKYRQEAAFAGSIVIAAGDVGQAAADDLIRALPSDRPILIHCGNGVAARRAYDRALELRRDFREIAFIDGAPIFGDSAVRTAR